MKVNLKNPVEFKKILIIRGYSQKEFAADIDITSPYFSQIINGERSPSGKVAKKIVDKLELNFDDIFFIEDDSKS